MTFLFLIAVPVLSMRILAEGLVVEKDEGYYYRNPYYLLPDQLSCTYTSGLYNKYYVFAPYAQGILTEGDGDESISFQSFLTISDEVFAKADAMDNMEDFDKNQGDVVSKFQRPVDELLEDEEPESEETGGDTASEPEGSGAELESSAE